MKTIEQKAKAYDEALAKAREIYRKTNVVQKGLLENLFPELAESEDERIRKTLIDFFSKGAEYGAQTNGVCNKDILAWLKKQGNKDKLIKELGEYKVKYTQEVLEKHLNSMNNKDSERLRKTTIAFLKEFADKGYENAVECIDWLEESVDRDKLAKGVLRGVANSIMQWLDANVAEGNMCLSNMECEDIENSVINAYWSNIYGYMKKKLEKQGESQKSDVWTEKDKIILEGIIDEIEVNKNEAPSYDLPTYDKYLNWLKSLKKKIINE